MTVHRYHREPGDPPDAILYDDCERCAEQAATPLLLDADKTAALYRRMIRVERHEATGAHYATAAEGTACRALYHLALFVERHMPDLNPWVFPWRPRGVPSETVWVPTGIPEDAQS